MDRLEELKMSVSVDLKMLNADINTFLARVNQEPQPYYSIVWVDVIKKMLDLLLVDNRINQIDFAVKTGCTVQQIINLMKIIDHLHLAVLEAWYKDYSEEQLDGESHEELPCNKFIPYNLALRKGIEFEYLALSL